MLSNIYYINYFFSLYNISLNQYNIELDYTFKYTIYSEMFK